MDWFRFYTGTIYDRKIRRLPPAQRWLWVTVLSMARMSPKPGHLLLSEGRHSDVTVTIDDLQDAAAISRDETIEGMETFIRQNMVHQEEDGVYVVTHWDNRQFSSDGGSKERMRKFRERKKASHVTSQERHGDGGGDVNVTPPDTDTETDLERDRVRAQQELVQAYEQICGPMRRDEKNIRLLLEYLDEGVHADLVIHALKKSSNADYPAKYADSIVRGYLAKDIKTLEQAIEHEGVSIRYESRSRGTKTTVRTGSEPSITGTGHIIGRIPPRQEQVR